MSSTISGTADNFPIPPSAALVEDLAAANHVLFDNGILDAFGHASARNDNHPDQFVLSRSMAPGLVQASDLMIYNLDAEPLNADGRASYLERFIHAEIYKARPEVMAIVHSHSQSVIPFAISSVALRPVYHMAGFLKQVPRFEIRDRFGDATDVLVSDRAKGCCLAAALGQHSVALMRGHGMVAVGNSIMEAVFRSVYTEYNARIQIQAIGLGGTVEYLTDAEAAAIEPSLSKQCERSWALWKTASAQLRRERKAA
jgi:ribulose-5-phosphate 4-epimerase/fuculose-1-phosphate aldolase